MLTVTALSLLLAAAPVQDTLVVERAYVSAPAASTPVYAADTADLGGKALPARDFLDLNAGADFLRRPAPLPILRGEPLPTDARGAALCVVRMTVVADRYTKASLHYNKRPADCTLYADGQRADGQLVFKPGVTELALLCATDTARADTFDVSLVGEHAATLRLLAPDEPRPLTLTALRSGLHTAGVRLSPSGKYLVTDYYDTAEDGAVQHFTTLTETATGRVLARQDGQPGWRWMPRRDAIYYTREWNKRTQLVVRYPADATERVVADALPTRQFTMAPTEDYIVYTRRDDARGRSGALRRLEQPDDRMPGWGERGALYRYDLTTGIARRLTFGRESASLFDLSPDGQRMLFAVTRTDLTREPFERTTLLEIDFTTGRTDTLLLDTTFIQFAQYANDGRTLLVRATPNAFGGIGSQLAPGRIGNMYDLRLFAFDPATRQARALLPQFDPTVDQVVVPEQGDKLYLLCTDGSGRTLWQLDTRTLGLVRYTLPVTSVASLAIARQGKKPVAVFTGYTGERARECYRTALADKPAPQCTRIGLVDFDSLYHNTALGTCRDWAFRSTRGDSIRGFYYLPADFDPSRRYPLVVYYYGGCMPTPKAFEFQYPHAVLAAQGYVVYVVEPSGTVGFGQEFAARHVGTWGQGTADDIIEGTRAFCAAHPFIDSSRIGCIGASYGGFMTQYLQTRTDLFRTAISHAGISNIASYWGGGYWGYSYGQVAQYGEYPWSNPRLYTEQSPLFHADRIHTPLLLLHGTADTNVPTTESQQLFTALRILGRPVSFVTVDGENHVIQQAAKYAQWQEAICAWFAYWLQDRHEWWRALFPDDDFGIGKRD
ncbi:MAG: S9 family peptidase [Bacteroidaceae bacterium]|nr:S9 family peptidase [Bacteroidaceae bacterium]